MRKQECERKKKLKKERKGEKGERERECKILGASCMGEKLNWGEIPKKHL